MATLASVLRRHGARVLAAVLATLMASRHAQPGAVAAAPVAALAALYGRHPGLVPEPQRVIALLDRLSFPNGIGREAAGTILSRLSPLFEAGAREAGRRHIVSAADFADQVLDLADRHHSVSQIAAILKAPYAEVRAVLDGVAAGEEGGEEGGQAGATA